MLVYISIKSSILTLLRKFGDLTYFTSGYLLKAILLSLYG